MPEWDKDWEARGVGTEPILPPPDPWAPRRIRYRHDTQEVSMDGAVKAVKRVPQWVDVIDRAELTEWRPLDIGDLARRLPNVVVGDGGSPFLQIPTIRGFGGDRVKILTDGVWPGSQALGFHGGTLSLWDPESTERVEVFHGPGVYLKGIDAPGGMINIVPRRPRRHGCATTADFRVASSYRSSNDAFRERAEVDVGRDRIAALLGVTWTTTGDRDTGGGTIPDSSYDEFAADAAVDWFLDSRSTIGLTLQHVQAYDVGAPVGTGSSLAQPEFSRTFAALTITSFGGGGVFQGSRASISFDAFLQDEDDAFAGSTSGIASSTDADRFDFHLEGYLRLFGCHDTWAELTVAYAHLDKTETLVCPPPGPPVPKPGDAHDHGGFFPAVPGSCNTAIATYEAEEWLVSGLLEDQTHDECWDRHIGARFDLSWYEDSKTGESDFDFLGAVAGGVASHYGPRLTGFANGSFGWRRPSIHERTVTAVVDGRTLFGNDTLDPEFHAHAEVGVKGALKDRASWQAALFGHYTDDYIGPADIAGPGSDQELRNLSEAFTYGFEVGGAWRPCTTIEGWELFGTMGTTFSTDDDVVLGLPFLWRTGARYSVPQPKGYRVRRWFGELSIHGASESSDGPRGGDPYATADLILGTGVDLGNRRGAWLHLGVTNLLDANYTAPASILTAPGLGLFANLEIKF
jgi:outer membrane receptor protein involved in Fe transport